MPLDLTDDKSPLVQVMAWCRQATSHYLSQYWPRSMSPNGVTKPPFLHVSSTVFFSFTNASWQTLKSCCHDYHYHKFILCFLAVPASTRCKHLCGVDSLLLPYVWYHTASASPSWRTGQGLMVRAVGVIAGGGGHETLRSGIETWFQHMTQLRSAWRRVLMFPPYYVLFVI